MESSYYLKQYWPIIIEALQHSAALNFIGNVHDMYIYGMS